MMHKEHKKILSVLMAIIFLTPLKPSAVFLETWANWETRLDRSFSDINPRKIPGRAMGIVVPSDPRFDLMPMSAFGFEALSYEKLNTVVFLMPMPKKFLYEGLLIPDVSVIETSFGVFPVDNNFAEFLKTERWPVVVDNTPFFPELPPLLVNQLACLKYILKTGTIRTKILPVYVRLGDLPVQVKDIGATMAERMKDLGMDQNVTFVISGNLTSTSDENELIDSDSHILTDLRSLDIDGLLERSPVMETPDALILGMMILKWLNGDHGEILAYSHTKQLLLTVDKQKHTGFVAAAVAAGPPFPNRIAHVNREKLLSIFDELLRSDLLALTRQSVSSILAPTAAKPPSLVHKQASRKWPVFISLYGPDGNLAGQAGSHVALAPLEESIRQYTFEAVQRAKPLLTKENMANYVVDVSIPHGFMAVRQPDDLIPQLNGIIVEHGHRKDSFHPDAWRKYPDPHQLLSTICTNLRLKPWGYATNKAKIESFRVLAFNEKEPFVDLGAAARKKKKRGDDDMDDDGGSMDGGGGGFPF